MTIFRRRNLAPRSIVPGGAFYARQPIHIRVAQHLGFGRCAPDRFDDISDDDLNWATGRFETETFIRVDILDRLRLLVSGKMMVVVSSKTSVSVQKAISRSNVAILSPFDPA